MRDLKSTVEACREFNFGPEITAEMCWNEGYRLGRERWYWGPRWMVNVIGWINTQKQKLRELISLPTCAKSGNASGAPGEARPIETKSP